MELSVPAPRSPSDKVYQECPDEGCTPRLFQLGDAPDARCLSATAASPQRTPGPGETICPYCGQIAEDDEFVASQDVAAIKKYVEWAAVEDMAENVNQMFKDAFRGLPKRGPLTVTVKGNGRKRPPPVAIRDDLLRDLICPTCERGYGVYAIALFCPDCGAANIQEHFRREADLIDRQLELARSTQVARDRELAFRLLGNAHEDVLTASETTLKVAFRWLLRVRLPERAAELGSDRNVRNSFQNIGRTRELYGLLGLDPYASLSEDELARLDMFIQKRHVVGHNLSLADDRYSTLTADGAEGKTVSLLESEVTEFVTLCSRIVQQLSVSIASSRES